jgi:hypothetical protein
MKVTIATPAYDHKVTAEYAMSLASTVSLLNSQGIEHHINFLMGDSLVVSARNKIVEQFWNSDSTHLLCIDSDLSWPPLAVLACIQSKKEFIGGLYPTRYGNNKDFIYRPSLDSSGNKILDGYLMKVDYMPAGFMLMERGVIKKLRLKFPELKFKSQHDPNDRGYCFFNTELHDDEFWGEDFIFCKRLREAGIDLWVDTLIPFKHGKNFGSVGQLPNGENPYTEE